MSNEKTNKIGIIQEAIRIRKLDYLSMIIIFICSCIIGLISFHIAIINAIFMSFLYTSFNELEVQDK